MEELLKDNKERDTARRTKQYRVLVRETFGCYVDVCAGSRDEARALVEKQIDDCVVVVPRDYDAFDRKISVREVRR